MRGSRNWLVWKMFRTTTDAAAAAVSGALRRRPGRGWPPRAVGSRPPVQADDRRGHPRRHDRQRTWRAANAADRPLQPPAATPSRRRCARSPATIRYPRSCCGWTVPGARSTASETIFREVVRARERGKPVVASMGAVAASGGYYVSMGSRCDRGQSGHDHRFDRCDHRKAGGSGSQGPVGRRIRYRAHQRQCRCLVGRRAFTPEQRAHREAEADLFYADFVERVADGRNMSAEEVDRRCPRPGLDRRRRAASAAWSTNSAAFEPRCAEPRCWPVWTRIPRSASSVIRARRCWTWCAPVRRRNRPRRRCRRRWPHCWADRLPGSSNTSSRR